MASSRRHVLEGPQRVRNTVILASSTNGAKLNSCYCIPGQLCLQLPRTPHCARTQPEPTLGLVLALILTPTSVTEGV